MKRFNHQTRSSHDTRLHLPILAHYTSLFSFVVVLSFLACVFLLIRPRWSSIRSAHFSQTNTRIVEQYVHTQYIKPQQYLVTYNPPHISKHTWPCCTGYSLCYCCIINIFSHRPVTNQALLLHMSNLHLAPVSNIPPRARVMKLIKNMQPLTYQLLFVFTTTYTRYSTLPTNLH